MFSGNNYGFKVYTNLNQHCQLRSQRAYAAWGGLSVGTVSLPPQVILGFVLWMSGHTYLGT